MPFEIVPADGPREKREDLLIPDEIYTDGDQPNVYQERFKVIAQARLSGNWNMMSVGGMNVGAFFANAVREEQKRMEEEEPQSLVGSATEVDPVAWRSSDGKVIEPPSAIMCPTCEARDSEQCSTCSGRGTITVKEAHEYRRPS